MHRRACKQYILQSYNFCFQCCTFWWRPFTCQCTHTQKNTKKMLKGLKFSIFIGHFKWYHGSEGVNLTKLEYIMSSFSFLGCKLTLYNNGHAWCSVTVGCFFFFFSWAAESLFCVWLVGWWTITQQVLDTEFCLSCVFFQITWTCFFS